MDVKLGTYNVNNLFDRFDDPYSWEDNADAQRTKPKSLDEIYQLGQRLREDKPDVLALQEVEGKGILYEFNVSQLGRFFKDLALIPGNDPRRIDVAVASRFPLGQMVSYQFIRDSENGRKLFSRDLLEVEILSPTDRRQRLFTLFTTHLKSKYVDPKQSAAAKEKDSQQADRLRWKQATTIASILQGRFPNPNAYYAVVGDLNDTPDANTLAPLLKNRQVPLVDVLSLKPVSERWTHYWAREKLHSQIDYILLSPALARHLQPDSVHVVQQGFIGGSDHRPVYATLQF